MSKIHHGKAGFGTVITTCGNQGGHKAKNQVPSVCNGKMFAYIMATSPEECCEHCKAYVEKEFPNSVKAAQANPAAFAAKHNLM